MGTRRFGAVMVLLTAVALAAVRAQSRVSPFPGTLDQHPAIQYAMPTGEDPVSRLDRRLELGDAKLAFEPRLGYLRLLLAALDVPVESQLLLFSKTAVQQAYTSPETPRALYFNDTVVVGYIPGAPLLEVAAHDPRQGVRFFSLTQDANSPPSFATHERCLTCHLSSNSLDVPGLLVRSMFTGPDGGTRPQMGSVLVDHRVPLERRWGGWYVTGTHGQMRHLGNAMVDDTTGPEAAVSAATLNQRAISLRVDTRAYPLPSSDIVALMVFDHQARAVNLLTRLGWEARMAAQEQRLDFARGELRDLSREVADYLLFVDEAPIAGPVEGVSGFAKVFAAEGPRDAKGRSLRDFDLQTRLLRYRCSYMVYSPAFDALPKEARASVVARMKEILSTRPPEALEILKGTKGGF